MTDDFKCLLCDKERIARGYCGPHYKKMRRKGELRPIREYTIDPNPLPRRKGIYTATIIHGQKIRAKNKKAQWKLANQEAYGFITGDCYYCGTPSQWPNGHHSIERIDEALPYEFSNCMTCCRICIRVKRTFETPSDFMDWALQIMFTARKNRPD